jgi:hypothetical protein
VHVDRVGSEKLKNNRGIIKEYYTGKLSFKGINQ